MRVSRQEEGAREGVTPPGDAASMSTAPLTAKYGVRALGSAVSLTLGFEHLGEPGRVSVVCEPNDDPEAVGKGADARGFPMCTATIAFPGRGYRSLLGWIQLVRSTDNESSGAAFEIDPARFFEDSRAPFCFYGFAPTLFDAPSRDDRSELDWVAHTFLAFVPRDRGSTKAAVPLLGFSWGFRIDDRGTITLARPGRLSAEDWLGHVPYLKRTYPTWSFPAPAVIE